MNIFRKTNIIKQCIFEFFGTGLVIFLNIGSLTTSKLTNYHFNQFEISSILGFSVSIAIYLSVKISGAHFNPAITIFFWLSSQFHKRKVLPYIISQISGSCFFSMLVYYLYNYLSSISEHKNNIIKGTKAIFYLASIFCIYPNYNNSFIYNFIIEIFSTAFFMIILLEFNNIKNHYFIYHPEIIPILIGILVCIINFIVGSIYSISLNPARDLGPKIFFSLHGLGTCAFLGENTNFFSFLIPIIGPILGTNIGGWSHKKLIQKNFKNMK